MERMILECTGNLNKGKWGYRLTDTSGAFNPLYEIEATEKSNGEITLKASFYNGQFNDDDLQLFLFFNFLEGKVDTDKKMHDRAIEIYERNKNPFELELGRQAYDRDIPLEDVTQWAQRPVARTSNIISQI